MADGEDIVESLYGGMNMMIGIQIGNEDLYAENEALKI